MMKTTYCDPKNKGRFLYLMDSMLRKIKKCDRVGSFKITIEKPIPVHQVTDGIKKHVYYMEIEFYKRKKKHGKKK